MSDVESGLPDNDNKSVIESKSNEYSNLLNLINESVTNTKLAPKNTKSKPKTNKNSGENTKVKKRRQRSTIVAPPSEELVPEPVEPTVSNIEENSENWTGDDTADELLDFDGGTVEFNVQISRFVALAAAMLVVEIVKQPKPSNNIVPEKQLSKTEQLMRDSKRSLPKAFSLQPSKEVLKISSKDTSNLNPMKDEKAKTFSYRRNHSSKEIPKQEAASNNTRNDNEKPRNSLPRNNPSSKEVLKKNLKQDENSNNVKFDKSKKSISRSKQSSKEVSKDNSKQDIDSSATKEEKSKKPSKTKQASKEVSNVSSNQDQNSNVTKDDKSKKSTSRSKQPRKEASKDSSKQDIDSSTPKEETTTTNQKKPTSKINRSSKEVLKVSSNQDHDINSNVVKEDKPKRSKIKSDKQSSKEILKVGSNQDQDINSNFPKEEQPKKPKSKKSKSNAKNTLTTITTSSSKTQVRVETAEVLDFDQKQNEPEEKPRRPAKKKRNKKPISPIIESQVEREPATAGSKVELETFLVEATGQSENVVTNFSTKRKSKKSVKNKKPTSEVEASAPPSIPVNEEPEPEPEPVIQNASGKESTAELPFSTPVTPTTVPLLPPTASEVSISTTGSSHTVTYPPVPTIGANMGDQFEVLKFLVQIQNYINQLGYHHHHLGEQKIHINSRHSMKLQMAAAREIMQAGVPIKSLHAAVLAVHFTNSLEAVERFPIYFRSHVSSKEYKHIVLGIFVQGNYGALGISRDSGLQDKPASYHKLSDLIFEFAKCYGHSGHVLNEVHFGCVMPHDPMSSERLFTKSHVVPICGCLHSEVEKNIEKFAKQLRNKMGRACMKIKRKRLRDLKRLSRTSSNFSNSSRTGLLDYVRAIGSEMSNCANIRLRVLNMDMSVHLLDNGAIRLSNYHTKKK